MYWAGEQGTLLDLSATVLPFGLDEREELRTPLLKPNQTKPQTKPNKRTEACCIAQASLKLVIFLLQRPGFQDPMPCWLHSVLLGK